MFNFAKLNLPGNYCLFSATFTYLNNFLFLGNFYVGICKCREEKVGRHTLINYVSLCPKSALVLTLAKKLWNSEYNAEEKVEVQGEL